MSFWSTLGKIAGVAGAGIAAPFTAGQSLHALPLILSTAGSVAGALAGGRAQGRMDEAGINQIQDRNKIVAADTNLRAGSTRAGQAVQGDILAHAQPFRYTGGTSMAGNIPIPQSEGGLSPAIFSDSTRALGSQLSSDALRAQQTDHGNPASLTPLPQSTALDSILNTAALVGSGIDALGTRIPYRRVPRVADAGPVDPYQLPGFSGRV